MFSASIVDSIASIVNIRHLDERDRARFQQVIRKLPVKYRLVGSIVFITIDKIIDNFRNKDTSVSLGSIVVVDPETGEEVSRELIKQTL